MFRAWTAAVAVVLSAVGAAVPARAAGPVFLGSGTGVVLPGWTTTPVPQNVSLTFEVLTDGKSVSRGCTFYGSSSSPETLVGGTGSGVLGGCTGGPLISANLAYARQGGVLTLTGSASMDGNWTTIAMTCAVAPTSPNPATSFAVECGAITEPTEDVPPFTGDPCRFTFDGDDRLTGRSDGLVTAALVITRPQLAQISFVECELRAYLPDATLCDTLTRSAFGLGPLLQMFTSAKFGDACLDRVARVQACTTAFAIYGPTPVTIVDADLGCVDAEPLPVSTSGIGPEFDSFDLGRQPLLGGLILRKLVGGPLEWDQLGVVRDWTCQVVSEGTVRCDVPQSTTEWYCVEWAVQVATMSSGAHARGSAQCDGSPKVSTQLSKDVHAEAHADEQAGSSVPIKYFTCSAFDPTNNRAIGPYEVTCIDPPGPRRDLIRTET